MEARVNELVLVTINTQDFIEQAREFTAPQTVPSWLQLDSENMKGRILNLPKREDITLPINEQLIVELYSK